MEVLDRFVESLPHYVAMLVLIFVVLTVVEMAVGRLGFWVELVLVLVRMAGSTRWTRHR